MADESKTNLDAELSIVCPPTPMWKYIGMPVLRACAGRDGDDEGAVEHHELYMVPYHDGIADALSRETDAASGTLVERVTASVAALHVRSSPVCDTSLFCVVPRTQHTIARDGPAWVAFFLPSSGPVRRASLLSDTRGELVFSELCRGALVDATHAELRVGTTEFFLQAGCDHVAQDEPEKLVPVALYLPCVCFTRDAKVDAPVPLHIVKVSTQAHDTDAC